MKRELSRPLVEILALPPSREQENLIAEWINARLETLPVVPNALGSSGRHHEDYDDIRAYVLAHLLKRMPSQGNPLRLIGAVSGYEGVRLELRANAVLSKSFDQGFYRLLAKRFPAFHRCREQLRYAVRKYGEEYGLVITPRSRLASEYIARMTFHSRKSAHMPQRDDLLPYVPLELLYARGRRKLPILGHVLDRISLSPELQPMLPVTVLTSVLAEMSARTDWPGNMEAIQSDESAIVESEEMYNHARAIVVDWLSRKYFAKVQADAATRKVMLAVLDEYAVRHAADNSERTRIKDIVLELRPAMSGEEYEHSKLRAHVQYICARFRRAIRVFSNEGFPAYKEMQKP